MQNNKTIYLDNLLVLKLKPNKKEYYVTTYKKDRKKIKSIVIPSSYNGLPITSINDLAFADCKFLTNITIPNSITYIGFGAFYRCNSLESITIPNSIISISGMTFGSCINLTSVTIPNSVTSIGDYAFDNCTGLTNITIPNSVISIGACAFDRCKLLKVKKVNYKAFQIKNNQLYCRGCLFTPNEWSKEIINIALCKSGYHYCTNLFEIFNYYYGNLNKDIAIYECEIGDKIIESCGRSKCVTNTIKPIKKLSRLDIINILNGQQEK